MFPFALLIPWITRPFLSITCIILKYDKLNAWYAFLLLLCRLPSLSELLELGFKHSDKWIANACGCTACIYYSLVDICGLHFGTWCYFLDYKNNDAHEKIRKILEWNGKQWFKWEIDKFDANWLGKIIWEGNGRLYRILYCWKQWKTCLEDARMLGVAL